MNITIGLISAGPRLEESKNVVVGGTPTGESVPHNNSGEKAGRIGPSIRIEVYFIRFFIFLQLLVFTLTIWSCWIKFVCTDPSVKLFLLCCACCYIYFVPAYCIYSWPGLATRIIISNICICWDHRYNFVIEVYYYYLFS